jgi:DNA-binding transcriptional MocR family regulator
LSILSEALDMVKGHQCKKRASRFTIWIIEDDYDHEFRYLGHPLMSLQGMGPGA